MVKMKRVAFKYCKKCKTHTEHKVAEAKRKGLNATHHLTRGSKARVHLRGDRRGTGNYGKYSRPAMASRKMSGKKQSKKTDYRYTCNTCKKISVHGSGVRAKRVEFLQ